MSIRKAYREANTAHGHSADDAQLRVVEALAELQEKLQMTNSLANRLRRMLPFATDLSATRGIYLWGGVGRGKTYLMDLFFRSLAVEKKKRIHFHRMMHDIHARLKMLSAVADPLDQVAADIAFETRVLCFDEFFVSDIGDAMLLGRLLDGLFRRGVTLVATSNLPPADLYRDGLQRERFLPAIALLEEHTTIIQLDGEMDYRLKLLQKAGTYLMPPGPLANNNLAHYFAEIACGEAVDGQVLQILGRDLRTVRCAKGVAWFDFMEICDGPRSQEDYIEIARWYPTVIVSDIPMLGRNVENAARRFIALVDEFYERKVKLIVSAAAEPQQLYNGKRLEFAFQRTASRLMEMQSGDYLHAPHLA
jgi:cell division protein ZapE